MKVRGQWTYLYRAVDKHGNTIDFYLSPTRNTAAAKRFLGKALNGLKDWEKPTVINTDKAPTYAAALAELKMEGKCPEETLHRQVKYLNNIIEADHGKLKQLIRPVRGFKTLKTAYATIKGFEVMRALRKGQASRSTSRMTSAARPASSSAPSALAPVPWPKRSTSSTCSSNSKRPDGPAQPTAPFARPAQQIATEPKKVVLETVPLLVDPKSRRPSRLHLSPSLRAGRRSSSGRDPAKRYRRRSHPGPPAA